MRPKKPTARTARQATRRLDQRIADLLVPAVPKGGWIRAIRMALGMTQAQLAKRMGIARQNVASLEADEVDGAVTLARLARAANELGCELHYVLVPRKPLEDMVAEQARRRAEHKLGRINQSQALEASTMATDSLSRTVTDLAREFELNRPSDLWDE